MREKETVDVNHIYMRNVEKRLIKGEYGEKLGRPK